MLEIEISHDPKYRDRVDHLKNAAIWLSCHKRGKGGDISDKALSSCASFLAESGCGYEEVRCKRRHNWSEAIAVSLMSPRQGKTSWHAYAERLVLRNECTSRRSTDFGSLCLCDVLRNECTSNGIRLPKSVRRLEVHSFQ
ncbi:unnamed protein product [Linum trigynum]|uniref:Uncharacterized protein n=1 Tax=Linum trigynum TaxID=586398 RepID=A0AAV2FUN3_9ROSI